MIDREAIYTALFAKLQTAGGFKTYSRHLRHWDDVAPHEQPALFLAPVEETVQPHTATGSRYLMRANVYVYVHSDNTPSVELNRRLDALTQTMNTPHPITGQTTLPAPGVERCRIEGQIEMDEGLFGEQAFAVVPIVMLVTDAA